jgi:folate-binding protein YgfZ
MSAPGDSPARASADEYGVLAVRGPDSAKFLQGQLSADTEALAVGASTLAGLHNPQGRVIAVLAITRPAADEFLAALPLELVDVVVQRLRKFVLRARLKVDDVSCTMRVVRALQGAHDPRIAWGDRVLQLVPQGHAQFDDPGSPLESWNLAGVRQGLPLVYSATSEQFVAQMLNLDVLGAISFTKGCYTGQEVIARAHYRGRVKRRMQRWLNSSGTELEPGDTARSVDGRSLTVVRGARDEQGRQEVLAVGTFGPRTESSQEPDGAGGIVVDGPLPLPYALPE